MKTQVELVATGSELLSGRIVNRHAQVLGEALLPLGLTLSRETSVPDDITSIADAVRLALQRVDIVLVSGGLGPTTDDVTREAVAELLGRRIIKDEASLEGLKAKYRVLGRDLSPVSERQILVLEGSTVLENPVGMAPGQRIEVDGKVLFILPGPPREFNAVLNTHVLPWLREAFRGTTSVTQKILMVCGVGESDLAAQLEAEGFPPPGLEVAYCASGGRVEVRLTAPSDRDACIAQAADVVRRVLGQHIFAEDRLTMEEVVGQLLLERKATLATAESCTGGGIGHRITRVSGSSSYYMGGIIAYDNRVKISELGVSEADLAAHGAVSKEVAVFMAQGVREKLGTDYALSITGVAGPTGGTPEKPVGLVWMAVADKFGVASFSRRFPGDRDWIRESSGLFALDLLRRRILGFV
jgi:nicotinamide-nucleotide amidase